MLQIQNISKQYTTGGMVQNALDGVSVSFRDNEFVAILGPSGSGKTTFLNIIGGLDRYDSGDLIINGISTKKYKDRDWDSYRNHTIGFVFQSYNLIPHQSVLANVELALTISGISRAERRTRAKNALDRVGLSDHIHKRPNQLSGGQMQRVAIARALVNDPDILLADEPTGALATETSIQVMELLKEVASDRLVVMVTHNPELAEEYATRTVKLKDGKIVGDTAPFIPEAAPEQPKHKNMGKSSMSFLTSLALSFNNLRTKKARTLLTSFAGSIGIIGIALILSLSAGVNNYIEDLQKDTMASYPIQIDAKSFDLSSLLEMGGRMGEIKEEAGHPLDAVYSDATAMQSASKVSGSLTENNLTEFKKYLDNPESEIRKYLGDNGVVYSYDVNFDIYTYDPNGKLINTKGSSLAGANTDYSAMMGPSAAGMNVSTMMNNVISTYDPFGQLIPGKDGELVSRSVTDNYELVEGTWTESYIDIVIVVDANNEIALPTLYMLGLLPSDEYNDLSEAVDRGESLDGISYSWNYSDLIGRNYYVIPACDGYEKTEDGKFVSLRNDPSKLEELAENGIKLRVSGIIRASSDSAQSVFSSVVGYTSALTDEIIALAEKSEIVKAQRQSPDKDIISGMSFDPDDDETKIEDTKTYISSLGNSGTASQWKTIAATLYSSDPAQQQVIAQADENALAAMLDAFMQDPSDEVLLSIYENTISVGSYEDNLTKFGYVSKDAPTSINIYADTFESKDLIAECIQNYNREATEENQIVYTDFVALLISSVTTIINVISYVLIAFVSVSLVVSSIMIGIITYISVLERTKEIGILRAIGASKRNVSQVFTAETFIIGLCSGAIGVGLSALLLIPVNAIIHAVAGTSEVSAVLPVGAAIILVIISVILTLIGGMIPSRKAAKKDPVTALRSE